MNKLNKMKNYMKTTQGTDTAVTLNIEMTTTADGVTLFKTTTNSLIVGVIRPSKNGYFGDVLIYGQKHCITYPDALEYVNDGIEKHFEEYGINVQYLTNEGQIETEKFLQTRRVKGEYRTLLVDRRTGKPVKMKNEGKWYGITLENAERIAQGLTLATHVKNAGVDIYDMKTGNIVSRIN